MAIFNIAPLLGPSLGPIAGAFIAEYTSWRWIFFVVSILDSVAQIAAWLFLQESFAPVLLKKRRQRLITSGSNTQVQLSCDQDVPISLGTLLRTWLLRCLRLLATQPILQMLAVYLAYVYGLIYLAFSTFPLIWTDIYQESTSIGSLNYLSLGIGYLSGSFLCGMMVDQIYKNLRVRNNGQDQPEFRIPMMILASLLVPVGLCWYGWSAQAHLHWILPNIGAAIFSMGVIMIMQCVNTYIVDAYPLYAASAIGTVTLVRNIPGTCFPLFAPSLYDRLGFGWGNTVLALVSVCIGFPVPFILWTYGKRLRRSSQLAAG